MKKNIIIPLNLLSVLLTIIVTIFFFNGCDSPVESDPVPSGYARIIGQVDLPSGVNQSELNESQIYLIGKESDKVYSNSNGNFSLLVEIDAESNNGKSLNRAEDDYEYELIVVTRSTQYGRKFDFNELDEGEEKDLGQLDVSLNGSISGNATLENQNDHTGISLFIPGTGFFAMSDSLGNYVINNIPAGDYNYLRADKDGYYFSVIEDILVQSGEITILPNITLLLSTGAFGGIILNNGDQYTASLDMDLSIFATNDAVLMMYSDNPSLFGGEWKIIDPFGSFSFINYGLKSIYIKFADANGLESPVYSDSITILENPRVILNSPLDTIQNTLPNFDWSNTLLPNSTYHLQISKDSDFIENVFIDTSGIVESNYFIDNILNTFDTFYWRVSIIDNRSIEWSWSETGSFDIDLGIIDNVRPSHNEIITNQVPLLNWDDLPYINRFELEISETLDFNNPIIQNSNLTLSEYQVTNPLASDRTYHWRVRVIDINNIVGEWNEIHSFEIINATEVGGTYDNDLLFSLSESPYLVSEDIIISAGYTLSIEAGVRIIFAEETSLRIDGQLIARGNEGNEIIFTGTRAIVGNWKNIMFTESSISGVADEFGNYLYGSILEYCSISYGGSTSDPDCVAILQSEMSSPFIINSTISNSQANGIFLNIDEDLFLDNLIILNNLMNGIAIRYKEFNKKLSITNSQIDRNNLNGVSVSGKDQGQNILSISNNNISLNNGVGIGISYFIGEGVINNNNISNNNNFDSSPTLDDDLLFIAGGVSILRSGSVLIESNTISDNIGLIGGALEISERFVPSTYAVYNILENEITRNNAEIGGAAYFHLTNTLNLLFKNNLVENNSASIDGIIYFASEELGSVFENNSFYNNILNNGNTENSATFMIVKPWEGDLYVSLPIIRNNNFQNSENLYEIRTNNPTGSNNISAINNWWGTINENEIENRIFDWNDNGNFGIIEFQPYLLEPDPNTP